MTNDLFLWGGEAVNWLHGIAGQQYFLGDKDRVRKIADNLHAALEFHKMPCEGCDSPLLRCVEFIRTDPKAIKCCPDCNHYERAKAQSSDSSKGAK